MGKWPSHRWLSAVVAKERERKSESERGNLGYITKLKLLKVQMEEGLPRECTRLDGDCTVSLDETQKCKTMKNMKSADSNAICMPGASLHSSIPPLEAN